MMELTAHQSSVGNVLQAGNQLITQGTLSEEEEFEIQEQMTLLNARWEALRVESMDRQSRWVEAQKWTFYSSDCVAQFSTGPSLQVCENKITRDLAWKILTLFFSVVLLEFHVVFVSPFDMWKEKSKYRNEQKRAKTFYMNFAVLKLANFQLRYEDRTMFYVSAMSFCDIFFKAFFPMVPFISCIVC